MSMIFSARQAILRLIALLTCGSAAANAAGLFNGSWGEAHTPQACEGRAEWTSMFLVNWFESAIKIFVGATPSIKVSLNSIVITFREPQT